MLSSEPQGLTSGRERRPQQDIVDVLHHLAGAKWPGADDMLAHSTKDRRHSLYIPFIASHKKG